MKIASVLAVTIVVLLLLAFGYSLFSYFNGANRLPPDLEGRLDWKEAVSEARHYRVYEWIACLILLPVSSFLLAIQKLPRVSWLRGILGVCRSKKFQPDRNRPFVARNVLGAVFFG